MRKRQWFNIVYALIGVMGALIIMLQLLLGDIIKLGTQQKILQSSTIPDAGITATNIVVEDKYKDMIVSFPTYMALNGTIPRQIGTKINLISGTTSTSGGAITTPTGGKTGSTGKPASKPPKETAKQYLTLGGLAKLSTEVFKNVELALPLDKDTYTIGTQFGETVTNKDGFKEFNVGVDLLTLQDKSSVYACLGGVVTFVGNEDDGWGNKVIVQSNVAGLKFLYASLSTVNVKVGDKIQINSIIGTTGNNSYSKTSHLHLEIFDAVADSRYDPEKFSYK